MMRFLNVNAEEISHKHKIMQQIERCNILFSGFEASPESIDPTIQKYSYLQGSHQGKKIALAVLTLLANAESMLPVEFYERLKKNNLFLKAFEETEYMETNPFTNQTKQVKAYKYLSQDPNAQFEGIYKIWEFYKELLNAIYSTEDFSDIRIIDGRADINYFDMDEEKALFDKE